MSGTTARQLKKDESLTEAYTESYYNKSLRDMSGKYTDERWFASPERVFDYKQTERALRAALGKTNAVHALEIGPGDGVWTGLLLSYCQKVDLLDQSVEMLNRAKENLDAQDNVSYLKGNIADYDLGRGKYDLIQTVRCVEYVIDKDALVKKLSDALTPGGKLVIITKNPDYRSLRSWKKPLLHTEQLGLDGWVDIIKKHGLVVDAVYPAVMRWKSSYFLPRLFFTALHLLSVKTGGRFSVPFLTKRSTESFAYVVHKEKRVVELYGLSGSGKTTLSKELEEEEPLVTRFVPSKKGAGLIYFMVRHPVIFFSWSTKMIADSLQDKNKLQLLRYRLAILLASFEAIGRVEWTAKEIAVVDEGYVQRVNSLYEREMSAPEFASLLKGVKAPDLVIAVDRTDVCLQRYESESSNPRSQLGEDYMKEWKKMIFHNNVSLVQALDILNIPVTHVTRETASSDIIKILRTL